MSGAKLLLVEDNDDLALLWEKFFGSAGFAVTLCQDGQCAVDAFAKDKFDLVASDFVLPDMTGTDVLDKLRASDPKVPFVLLTGMREQSIMDHVARAGNAVVILKPVGFKDLLAKIQDLMGTG